VLQATAQGMRFEGCSVGIDASSGSGMLSLIDSSATNTSVVVAAAAMSSSSVTGSLVLENVVADSTVAAVSWTSSCTCTWEEYEEARNSQSKVLNNTDHQDRDDHHPHRPRQVRHGLDPRQHLPSQLHHRIPRPRPVHHRLPPCSPHQHHHRRLPCPLTPNIR
jgi:hypothetical protein